MPGTISGGQNIDGQRFCKVFSGLSALQEMRRRRKQKHGSGRKEIGAGTDTNSEEDNK